jgi:hypothetical protein
MVASTQSRRFAGFLRIGLLGAISNPELQARLRLLSDKLDALASGDAKPQRSGRADRRLQGGVLLDAIVSVLSAANRPMQPHEIQAAAAALLGKPVAPSSVKTCLSAKGRSSAAAFERTDPGFYRLRED